MSQEKNSWVGFNLNHRVRFRVTETGHAHIAELNRKGRERGWTLDMYTLPKTDEDGFRETQLWALMEMFGSEMTCGSRVPIETTIFLDGAEFDIVSCER